MCFDDGDTRVVESQSSSEIPKYLQNFSKKTLNIADDVTSRPYEAYGGQRVAQFNPDEQAAFEMTRNQVGQYQPFLQQAGEAAGQVANRQITPFSQADISGYMNPYTENVINASLGEMDRAASIERNQINARMANPNASAYGGSRHGIVESEQRRNTTDLKNNIIAQLYSNAYGDAANAYRADQTAMLNADSNRLGAAGQLAGLATSGQQLGYADAAAMRDIGGQQRQLEQQGLDVGYSDFLRQFNYPIEMLNLRSAVGSSQPYSTSSITEQEQLTGNSMAQGLGAFAALAGGGASLYGAF